MNSIEITLDEIEFKINSENSINCANYVALDKTPTLINLVQFEHFPKMCMQCERFQLYSAFPFTPRVK